MLDTRRGHRIYLVAGIFGAASLAALWFFIPPLVCYVVNCHCKPHVIDRVHLADTRHDHVAFDPEAGRLYAAAADAAEIRIFETQHPTVGPIARVPTLGYHSGLAIDPVSHRAYVIQGFSHAVRVIDGTDFHFEDIAIPDLSNAMSGIALDPGRRRLYFGRTDDNEIGVVDLDTSEYLGVIGAGCCPAKTMSFAVDPPTGRLLVLDAERGLTILSPGGEVVANLALGDNPRAVAVDAERRRAYVTNQYSRNLSVVALEPGEASGSGIRVLGDIKLREEPIGIALDPGSQRAYVSNANEDSITAVDLGLGTLVGPDIVVGEQPMFIALDPIPNRVVVSADMQDLVVVQGCPIRRPFYGLPPESAPEATPTIVGYDDPELAQQHREEVLCERMFRTRTLCTAVRPFAEIALVEDEIRRAGARLPDDRSADRLCGVPWSNPEIDLGAAGYYYSLPVLEAGTSAPRVWTFHSASKTVGEQPLPADAAVTRLAEVPDSIWGEVFWHSSRCGTGLDSEACCRYRPDLFSNPPPD